MFSLKILWCSYWSITHLILDWAYTQPFWMQDHGVNPMDDTVQLRYFLHKSQVVGNSDDNITSAVREYSFSFVLATSSRRLSKCCWLCRVGHDQCSECPLSLPPRPLPGPRSDSSSCHTIVKIPVDAIQILPKLRTNQPKHLHTVFSRRKLGAICGFA